MAIALSVLMVAAAIALLIYWVKSLIVMSGNTMFLILGIFLSPFAQLGYLFSHRDKMDNDQITTMTRYFIAMGVYLVVFVFFMGSLMNQLGQT